jgi:hypothetical protein
MITLEKGATPPAQQHRDVGDAVRVVIAASAADEQEHTCQIILIRDFGNEGSCRAVGSGVEVSCLHAFFPNSCSELHG